MCLPKLQPARRVLARKTDRYVTFGLHQKADQLFFLYVTRARGSQRPDVFAGTICLSGVIFNVLDQFNGQLPCLFFRSVLFSDRLVSVGTEKQFISRTHRAELSIRSDAKRSNARERRFSSAPIIGLARILKMVSTSATAICGILFF